MAAFDDASLSLENLYVVLEQDGHCVGARGMTNQHAWTDFGQKVLRSNVRIVSVAAPAGTKGTVSGTKCVVVDRKCVGVNVLLFGQPEETALYVPSDKVVVTSGYGHGEPVEDNDGHSFVVSSVARQVEVVLKHHHASATILVPETELAVDGGVAGRTLSQMAQNRFGPMDQVSISPGAMMFTTQGRGPVIAREGAVLGIVGRVYGNTVYVNNNTLGAPREWLRPKTGVWDPADAVPGDWIDVDSGCGPWLPARVVCPVYVLTVQYPDATKKEVPSQLFVPDTWPGPRDFAKGQLAEIYQRRTCDLALARLLATCLTTELVYRARETEAPMVGVGLTPSGRRCVSCVVNAFDRFGTDCQHPLCDSCLPDETHPCPVCHFLGSIGGTDPWRRPGPHPPVVLRTLHKKTTPESDRRTHTTLGITTVWDPSTARVAWCKLGEEPGVGRFLFPFFRSAWR